MTCGSASAPVRQPKNVHPPTDRGHRKTDPARSGVADGKQPAHHRAADELREDLHHGERREQSGVVRAVDEGRGEALQRGLLPFAHAVYEER